jgi:hypothetical protein
MKARRGVVHAYCKHNMCYQAAIMRVARGQYRDRISTHALAKINFITNHVNTLDNDALFLAQYR